MWQKTTIIGNLTRDAQERRFDNGTMCGQWTVAVDIGYGDNKKTQYWDCTMWGERGVKAAQMLRKGRETMVEGVAQVRAFTKRDGASGYAMELTVDNYRMLRGGDDSRQAAESAPVQSEDAYEAVDDDDLPF